LDAAKELEAYGVDFWHIDSIENFSVFEDISALAGVSGTPIDLHIIAKQPLDYYPYLEAENIKRISFQIEELGAEFSFPKIKGMWDLPTCDETDVKFERLDLEFP
jgi:pentose-5-phosphate-3-epimerase